MGIELEQYRSIFLRVTDACPTATAVIGIGILVLLSFIKAILCVYSVNGITFIKCLPWGRHSGYKDMGSVVKVRNVLKECMGYFSIKDTCKSQYNKVIFISQAHRIENVNRRAVVCHRTSAPCLMALRKKGRFLGWGCSSAVPGDFSSVSQG